MIDSTKAQYLKKRKLRTVAGKCIIFLKKISNWEPLQCDYFWIKRDTIMGTKKWTIEESVKMIFLMIFGRRSDFHLISPRATYLMNPNKLNSIFAKSFNLSTFDLTDPWSPSVQSFEWRCSTENLVNVLQHLSIPTSRVKFTQVRFSVRKQSKRWNTIKREIAGVWVKMAREICS